MKIFMNEKEVADYLGYKVTTIQMSRRYKKLGGKEAPAHQKWGRTVRYKRSVVEAWTESFEEG